MAKAATGAPEAPSEPNTVVALRALGAEAAVPPPDAGDLEARDETLASDTAPAVRRVEWFWLRIFAMKQLSLADLIVRRVPLTAREAATLTLAVSREWDRQRAVRGAVSLPGVGAIALDCNGAVSFLIVPPASAPADAAPLTALLGQLLGIDESDGPRRPIPGGLLITMPGRLGQMELSTASVEGFRAALVRFADDDPGALAALFWRAASALRMAGGDRLASNRRHPRHVTERRRQGERLTELRREIRHLEQRAFESRRRPGTSRVSSAGPALGARGLAWAAVACAAIPLVLVLMEPGSTGRPDTPPSVGSPATLASVGPPRPESLPAAPAAVHAGPTVGKTRVTVRSPRPAQPPRNRKVAQADNRKPRSVALFPGGARAIAWAGSTR